MKNWKKLVALFLAGIMVFAFAACSQEAEEEETAKKEQPTEDTATEPTAEIEVPSLVVDPETFREYIGTWYADGSSASYRLIITEEATWQLTDAAGEVACSGSLRLNEEDELLELYDPDGSQAVTVTLEEAGVVHVDLMLETLTDTLSTNTFLNKITNDISDAPPTDIGDSSTNIDSEASDATLPSDIEEETVS